MEEGFGRRDVRFGAVNERRSDVGRLEVGCADIVRLQIVYRVQEG